ncbi:MAG: V-type ATP synthase subunit C [Clostridia bacterium]|nr:V-type ATP synthase subunit C [Clostridia bacterium]
MKTRDTEYLYATTRIRSLERGLLDRGVTDRLIEAASVEDMAKIMSELGYTQLQTAGIKDIENSLISARRETFELIESISPDSEICDVFRLRYDYHNIKAILKGEISGEDARNLLIDAGRFGVEALVSLMREREYKELPETVRVAVENARETLARTKDAQLCDFILDRAYFAEMVSLAKQSGSKFLEGYVKCLIDTTNLRATIRAMRRNKDADFLKNALQEGGNILCDKFFEVLSSEISLDDALKGTFLESTLEASGDMVSFERECDNAVMTYLRSARYVAFGEEPLVAYVAAKEADIITIRIILAGKVQELPADEIRERLRASYV